MVAVSFCFYIGGGIGVQHGVPQEAPQMEPWVIGAVVGALIVLFIVVSIRQARSEDAKQQHPTQDRREPPR
jgi:hypothetical protein